MDFHGNPQDKQRSRSRRKRRRLLLERLSDRRVLAAITGVVFHDTDLSLRQEAGEVALPQRLVYVDLNQNADLDANEPFSIADDGGNFLLRGIPDGDFDVRLYDGSASQQQVFPTSAVQDGTTVGLENATDVVFAGSFAFAPNGDSLTIGNLDNGAKQSIPVGPDLTQTQRLPDGNLLVIGGDQSVDPQADTAWVVNPIAGTSSPINLADADPIPWSDIALDSNGHGVAIAQSDGDAAVYFIDASDPDAGVVSTNVGITVPGDAVAYASDTGPRTLFAWAGSKGLELSIWSNSTATWINYAASEARGARELLAYDDASGLVALRTEEGGVSLVDANADFATLRTLPDVTGPVALSATKDLLFTTSRNSLQAIDVRDGALVADWDVDFSSVGSVTSIQYEDDNLVVVGDAGITKYSLLTPAAHKVTVANDTNPDPISFAVSIDGENELPYYSSPLEFETPEDTRLVSGAVNGMTGVTDPNDDKVVILGLPTTPGGEISLSPTGDFTYAPNLNFNGSDPVKVLLHDGRGATETSFTVNVLPTPDDPDVRLEVADIAEDAQAGVRVGNIQVLDPDIGDEHSIQSLDPRFVAQDGLIIFIGEAGDLNYETEPMIELGFWVTQIATDDTSPDDQFSEIVTATLMVTDANDPITDIKSEEPVVAENDAGADVADLTVEDEDTWQSHTLTVNDSRFVIIGTSLALAPGVALDFEENQFVTVAVTATEDNGGNNTFTKDIRIQVTDVPERVRSIELSKETVVELEPGAEVGEVNVDGFPLGDSNTATVNDSRFEVDGSTLKLTDGTWVERVTQEEIELTISVQDSSGTFDATDETFIISVVENPTPFHNDELPFDVNGLNGVSPFDALIIINYLNDHGPGLIEHGDPNFDYDVNGDGFITPLDALLILNELSAQARAQAASVGGEETDGGTAQTVPRGEQIDPSELDADDPEIEMPVNSENRPGQPSQFEDSGASFTSDIDDDLASDLYESTDADDFAEGVDASLDSLLDDLN